MALKMGLMLMQVQEASRFNLFWKGPSTSVVLLWSSCGNNFPRSAAPYVVVVKFFAGFLMWNVFS